MKRGEKQQNFFCILYFVHLLKYQNALEGNDAVTPKLLHPVSVHSIKQYHMDIDAEIIYYLMRDIGVHIPRHGAVDGRNMNAPTLSHDRLHIDQFNKTFLLRSTGQGMGIYQQMV
jgi:hypothetical protein